MLSLLTYLPMHNLHKLTCIPTDEGHCKEAETSVFKPLETAVFIPCNLTKASLNLGSGKVAVTDCKNCNHNQQLPNRYIPAYLVFAATLLVSRLDPTLS